MNNKAILSIILSFIISSSVTTRATGLSIGDMTWYSDNNLTNRAGWCTFTMQWDNAWNTAKNHDAAWVFIKLVRPGVTSRHVFIAKDGVKVITDHTGKNGKYSVKVSDDQAGFFIYPSDRYRGKVQLTLRVNFDGQKTGNIGTTTGVSLTAFGIEMVKIPAGSFHEGEPDSASARQFHATYLSDAEGKHTGVFEMKSEDQEINIGKGGLYYTSTEPQYQGDMKGTIAKEFPKGIKEFYCMKYELTQGQYADFLTSLNAQHNTVRSNIGGSQYYQLRGTIRYDGSKYIAGVPFRPCNFISWDDAMAYADWACLRPMTELEFTKAARGTEKPIANSFPWGTASKEKVQRAVNTNGDLVFINGNEEAQLTDNNRETFGASFYWVMDLAGSLWERVITFGDEKGRAFTGLHGDGQLSPYGAANVKNWPSGNDETGGFGFRGGGFYTHDRMYHEFNPYSPVSYRMYGAWSGGARVESYGSRFVRSE